jgi:hypothetical protein
MVQLAQLVVHHNFNGMGRFKKGLFFGSILGGLAAWFSFSPQAKEMRAKLALHVDYLSTEISSSFKKLEGPTKEMYDALVDRVVEEYAAKKDLALELKIALLKELKERWNELQK